MGARVLVAVGDARPAAENLAGVQTHGGDEALERMVWLEDVDALGQEDAIRGAGGDRAALVDDRL